MKKRFSAIIIAGLITAVLTACGSTASNEQLSDIGSPASNAAEISADVSEDEGVLRISKQGYFSAGGTVTEPLPGEYNAAQNWQDAARSGNTMHVDHANVFYQIPENDNGNPIVFLHGAGQSRMGWMTTPDGREGWSDIFLKAGHSVFLVDQPRRGEAGQTAEGPVDTLPGDQAWYTHFRIGKIAPDRYENSQFPEGAEAQDQFFRQMTPNTGEYDQEVIAQAMNEVLKEVYDMTGNKAVLVTHSQGGLVGWDVSLDYVSAIVAIEPGFAPMEGMMQEAWDKFMNLEDKIPVIFYYGDNIDNGPEDIDSTAFWQMSRNSCITFSDAYNERGGDAKVINLPDEGFLGNSHFLFQEMNNKEIADHVEAWLDAHGLCD
ncbi:MAG: alpha/beta fold hydrolase [Firmicutes bacterium]|nr:alpha/beta fold hydrolase [Bacillota bacterium]